MIGGIYPLPGSGVNAGRMVRIGRGFVSVRLWLVGWGVAYL
jgi:hypothetical protein